MQELKHDLYSFDCVGVTESDKTESKSLESKPSVSTEKLMHQIARGDRHSDSLRSLGNRLLRLDMKLDEHQRKQIDDVVKESVPKEVAEQLDASLLPPTTLTAIASNLIHGTNEDALVKKRKPKQAKKKSMTMTFKLLSNLKQIY